RDARHARRRPASEGAHHGRPTAVTRARAHDHRRVHPLPPAGGRVTGERRGVMPPRKAGYQQSMLPEVLSAGGQSLDDLRSEAATCEACDLHKLGTQTVFGEGPEDADLMLMGEVPGDLEDKAGHPFVGPAGKLLDRALVEAEIDRGNVSGP